MKRMILGLTVLLAACSGGGAADPVATETANAVTTASPTKSASPETPMTADRCIEDNKGLGTGTRGEVTKDCLVGACDQGDKKSCDMVKSFSGENDELVPPDDEQGPGEE